MDEMELKQRSLMRAIQKFEEAREKLEKHMGYCRSSEEIRILEEMIREQGVHENIGYTASAPE